MLDHVETSITVGCLGVSGMAHNAPVHLSHCLLRKENSWIGSKGALTHSSVSHHHFCGLIMPSVTRLLVCATPSSSSHSISSLHSLHMLSQNHLEPLFSLSHSLTQDAQLLPTPLMKRRPAVFHAEEDRCLNVYANNYFLFKPRSSSHVLISSTRQRKLCKQYTELLSLTK